MKTTPIAMILGLALLAGCAATDGEREERGSTDSRLNATNALWPEARIPVCWDRPGETPGRFPDPRFAPAPNMARKRQWVRAMAEEWSRATAIRFIGWNECDAVDATEFVRITTIDSLVRACGDSGQACVDEIGSRGRGKRVVLNLSFGDEFLAISRELAAGAANPSLAERPEGGFYWLPAACMQELRGPWFAQNRFADLQHDIDDPAVLARAEATIERCAKVNILHELGHVAGFAHEQYRSDDEPARRECLRVMADLGIADDTPVVPAKNRGDRPLGPFDSESIMSYCRLDQRPRLTEEDVAMALRAYGQAASADEDPRDGADGIGTSGGIGGKGGKAGASL